jgi:hypothetical protein
MSKVDSAETCGTGDGGGVDERRDYLCQPNVRPGHGTLTGRTPSPSYACLLSASFHNYADVFQNIFYH